MKRTLSSTGPTPIGKAAENAIGSKHGKPGSVAKLRDWSGPDPATLTPHEINTGLAQWLPQAVASRITSKAHISAEETWDGEIVDWTLSEGEMTLEQAQHGLAVIEALSRPVSAGEIAKELVRLKLLTASRKDTQEDIDAQLAAYVDLVARQSYPLDVLRAAVDELAGTQRFWPSWAELNAICAAGFAKRRQLGSALRDCIAKLQQAPNPTVAARAQWLERQGDIRDGLLAEAEALRQRQREAAKVWRRALERLATTREADDLAPLNDLVEPWEVIAAPDSEGPTLRVAFEDGARRWLAMMEPGGLAEGLEAALGMRTMPWWRRALATPEEISHAYDVCIRRMFCIGAEKDGATVLGVSDQTALRAAECRCRAVLERVFERPVRFEVHREAERIAGEIFVKHDEDPSAYRVMKMARPR